MEKMSENMIEIDRIDKEARDMGMTYGMYVGLQYCKEIGMNRSSWVRGLPEIFTSSGKRFESSPNYGRY